jgi:hypothetical protein
MRTGSHSGPLPQKRNSGILPEWLREYGKCKIMKLLTFKESQNSQLSEEPDKTCRVILC